MKNLLIYGDNLDILRNRPDLIPSACVDLIYLDPPFNSNADYNLIFKEKSGESSSAQIQAFTDSWHWDTEQHTAHAFEDVKARAPKTVANMVEAMIGFMGRTDLTAYLVMMTQRLIELRRVLKPTGSLYLHCDPTASHYLKVVLDTIFGPENFRGEITWKRTTAHNDPKRPGRIHDVLLFYTKSDIYTWNKVYTPYSRTYIESHYRRVDDQGRRYRLDNLTAPAHGSTSGQYEWHGKRPPQGRMWSLSQDKMDAVFAAGRVRFTRNGMPEFIRYLDEMPGVPLQDVWDDIPPVNSMAEERLGYPTQKPVGLLERVISASSNPGDVVLDPFCGCGTAIYAAQKLERQWIGIDVTHLAVSIMKNRLKTLFDLEPKRDYDVEGEPKDITGARQLALDDRYQFQYWAVSLVEAYAEEARDDRKKGADKGIDGTIPLVDGQMRKRQNIIVQVKSGHVTSSHIRDLRGVIERENAPIGLYICLEKPTADMREEASKAGFYTSELWRNPHSGDHLWPRLQIRTIEELLAGKSFELPPRPVMYKAAARVTSPATTHEQVSLFGEIHASDTLAGVLTVDDVSDDDESDDELGDEAQRHAN